VGEKASIKGNNRESLSRSFQGRESARGSVSTFCEHNYKPGMSRSQRKGGLKIKEINRDRDKVRGCAFLTRVVREMGAVEREQDNIKEKITVVILRDAKEEVTEAGGGN